ncbi:MAG: hypothetical protein HYY30_11870 [Chloroflexi bacterium]|nr:hypothetical protein [Chloroflexota bacterium]
MGTKVAVVDGEPAMHELADRLETENYEVSLCPFDAEVLNCIKRVQPDVVVMDLSGPPEALGLNIIPIIKTDPTLSVTPLVICTSPTPEVEQLVKQLARVGLYVIRGPCGVDEFINAIEQAVSEGK